MLKQWELTNGSPIMGLAKGKDGAFYGLTSWHFYRVSEKGEVAILRSWTDPGTLPRGGDAPTGKLVNGLGDEFFMTLRNHWENKSAIAQINRSGELKVVYRGFDPVDDYGARITVGFNNQLYFTRRGGPTAIHKLGKDGSFHVIHEFNSFDGSPPVSNMVLGPDGTLYGLTEYGGMTDKGTVFVIRTNDVLTSVYSFSGPEGEQPASLVTSRAGIFGLSRRGGQFNAGTFFQIMPDNTVRALESFRDAESNPLTWAGYDPLVEGPDGNLYYTHYAGGIHRYEPPYGLPAMPSLRITLGVDQVEIGWIGNGNELVLERAGTLDPSAEWAEVARANNTEPNIVRIPVERSGVAFYRLRRL